MTDNCQVAVGLSLATAAGSLPLGYRLYLSQEQAEDKQHCKRAAVPKEIAFATRGEFVWAQIAAVLAAGIPRRAVLLDRSGRR